EAEAPSARARRAEPRAPADYEAIGRALRASAGDGAPGDAAAAVIARLVHVHALRLAPRSPCPEQAHLELRTLTELASSLGAT
ncbi:MAG: hypothetical protein KC468_37195, partial [Myxococcales bacterium]|nr:hypothetical protein [Myxococcales bacterium]